VLCCAVLCCAVLRCAALRCAVLCCAVLCCAVLCCAVLCCAVLCLAVWWAASTFYPVGAGHNIAPYTLPEVVFTMVFMALNILLWGFILGSISLLVARSDEQSAKYRQRMVRSTRTGWWWWGEGGSGREDGRGAKGEWEGGRAGERGQGRGG